MKHNLFGLGNYISLYFCATCLRLVDCCSVTETEDYYRRPELCILRTMLNGAMSYSDLKTSHRQF